MQRRHLLAALPATAALPSAFAQAGAWPTKPIRIVVTFPPGGAPDTLARIFAEKWAPLGQPIPAEGALAAGGLPEEGRHVEVLAVDDGRLGFFKASAIGGLERHLLGALLLVRAIRLAARGNR